MTPDYKDPRFIRHDVPDNASPRAHGLYDDYCNLINIAQNGEWAGVTTQNFSFDYNTYFDHAEILFNFVDKNEHTHQITVAFHGDDVSSTCWFSYIFKANNFDENVVSVQSFAELLMLHLWEYDIDAELCNCDWGLEFPCPMYGISNTMGIFIHTIVSSIKPMEWFYSKESIWKFYRINSHLLNILPLIKREAETGRWKDVKPENFTILRDSTQAYIALT